MNGFALSGIAALFGGVAVAISGVRAQSRGPNPRGRRRARLAILLMVVGTVLVVAAVAAHR